MIASAVDAPAAGQNPRNGMAESARIRIEQREVKGSGMTRRWMRPARRVAAGSL